MAIVDLIMPKLGESITEATILKWNKKVGDTVKQDETVLEIATDKVDSEVPSTHAGIITEILFSVNDVVAIGTVIARLETETANQTSTPVIEVATIVTPPVQEIKTEVQPQAIQQIQPQEVPYVPTGVVAKVAGNNRFYSPLVLNIANSEGLNLSELENIAGTGAEGRVSKKDIIQYIEDKRAGKVVTTGNVTEVAPSNFVQPQPIVASPTPQANVIVETKR
jgi:2-oxoglutarate dehydrogenase E2 component (dihydrolipoamide succinyltransferase)